ncbi:MAG: homocysteine S-methyltransferase family protein [Planctomycetes bacterium]|nr:homocysteine S-methyltransferase family protein [Planctomycetota bacterium]
MPTAGRDVLLLDGATGTELDRRGVDVSLPLWSARALVTAPQVVKEIHCEYLRAGAGAITANTFRTHARTLAREPGTPGTPGAAELSRRAVEIARAARDELAPAALVMGSVAPLEDCYSPQLAPDADTCLGEHTELIGTLLDAGVDRILIETMNNLTEARAAMSAARRLAGDRWLVSFCVKTDGPPGTLLSGEPIATIRDELRDAPAVGVNCVAAPAVETQVEHLRAILPDTTRIIAYANIGYADDAGNWVATDAVEPESYAAYAMSWVRAGASVVGGCCGTTPATIRAVGRCLRSE